jgi:hypothetical protein
MKRGLFIYAPFLILLLYRIAKLFSEISIKEIFPRFLSNYLSVISVVSILIFSSFFEWTGGWCYGPRLIFFIAALLTFESIIFLSKNVFSLAVFWLAILFGFSGVFLAKSTVVYSIPSDINNPFSEQILPNFQIGNFNPNNLLTIIWNIDAQIANYLWLVAFIIILGGLTLLYKKENAKLAS